MALAYVSIAGTVERCPSGDTSEDGKPKELCFSLNLSVGLKFFDLSPVVPFAGGTLDPLAPPQDDSPELLKLVTDHLRPWAWGVKGLRVVGIANDQARILPGGAVRLAADGIADPDGQKNWVRVLERRLEGLTKDGKVRKASFHWPPVEDGGLGSAANAHTVNDDDHRPADSRNWAAELMHDVSTEPAPLPHAANLVRVFWVSAAERFDKLTALPVLKFAGPTDRQPGWIANVGRPIDLTKEGGTSLRYLGKGEDPALVWPYTDGGAGEQPVRGFVNAALRGNPQKEADNPDAGWVKLEDAVYGSDWLAELEDRAAEFFDLPGLLLKYLDLLNERAACKLTDPVLNDLTRAGLPEGVRAKLVPLKDRELPPAKFAAELAALLMAAEFEQHRKLVMVYAHDTRALAEALKGLSPLVTVALRDTVQTGTACGRRLFPGAARPAATADPTPGEWSLAGILLQNLLALAKDKPAQYPERYAEAFPKQAADALKVLSDWEQNADWVGDWWFGRFKITDAVLKQLADDNVGVAVVSKLAGLKDQECRYAEFRRKLATVLTPEEVRTCLARIADRSKKTDVIPGVMNRMESQLRPLEGLGFDELSREQQADVRLANLAVLHNWHAALADPKRVGDLIYEQWDAAFAGQMLTDAEKKAAAEKAALLPDAEKKAAAEKAALRASWWAASRGPLRDTVLPAAPSRKWLLLMHLGVEWDTFQDLNAAVGDLEAKIRGRLLHVLNHYTTDRTKPAGAVTFDDQPRPAAAANVDAFVGWLKDEYLPKAVPATVLAGSAKLKDAVAAVEQPDALVVQVAAVASRAADPQAESGRYGLLLRTTVPGTTEPDGPTRHLNLADVTGLGKDMLIAAAVFRPMKLMFRNGIRRGLVSYNNEPISARSPAAGLTKNHTLGDANNDIGDVWLEYANPYGQGDRPRLLALRFGQTYKVAAFRVMMAGVLPYQLADASNPTRLNKSLEPTTPGTIPWATVPYRRRVAVGPLRLESVAHFELRYPKNRRAVTDPPTGSAGTLGDDLKLPPIPATVLPLARSLDVFATHAGTATAAEALAESADKLSQSLILLAPQPQNKPGLRASDWLPTAARQFEFMIRPPSIDLRVWDRSFEFVRGEAAGPYQRTVGRRQAVWQQTHEHTDNPRPPVGRDITLDDPVVSGVLLRLTQMYPAGAAAVPDQPLPPFEYPTAADRITAEQRRPVRIRVESTPAGTPPAIGKLADAWVVTVPAGRVCTLELFAVVSAEALTHFPKGWAERHEYKKSGTDWLVPARKFAIEVAVGTMPTGPELLAALRARAVVGGVPGPAREPWGEAAVFIRDAASTTDVLQQTWRAEAALDPVRGGGDEPLDWIHRVSVLVQRWRWNGRPLRDVVAPAAAGSAFSPAAFFAAAHTPPDEKSHDDPPRLVEWDGLLFGDRDPADYRRHDTVVDFADRKYEDKQKAGWPIRVFQQDVTGDVGALYFRYAVQASSRYEGLFIGRGASQDSRLPKNPSAGPEGWRRLIVPCRYAKEIPQPRVKLVLPLTDTRDGEQTPGLLVVLNEPWFLYGGLAEEMTVEVASAEEPVRPTPADQPGRRSELGGDPLAAAGQDQVIVPPGEGMPAGIADKAYSFEPLPAYGPIGYTFDTATLAPQFVHTSYVVPAPELKHLTDPDATERNLNWYFIKLQFRRRIEPLGHYAPSADPQSLPTQSVWAQFLPPSSVYGCEPNGPAKDVRISVSDLRLTRNASGTEWWVARSGDMAAVPLVPTPVGRPAPDRRFQLWGLVTDRVHDAYGRPTQERFLTFRPLKAGELQLTSADKKTLPEAGRPRLRLVELQVLPEVGDAVTTAPLESPDGETTVGLVDYFFPKDPTGLTEARARWVRVSAPIDSPAES